VDRELVGGRGNARPRPHERNSWADGRRGGGPSRWRSRWGSDDGVCVRRGRRQQVGDDVHAAEATVRAGPPNELVRFLLSGVVRGGRGGEALSSSRVEL